MALKSVIYKAQLQVADMDRHYYADHALNIACHPSETLQRMMARILVFALHAHESLELAKGISDVDEPDLWQKDLTGAIQLWIELGQPEERRILKACGRAEQVIIYAYGNNAQIWWKQIANKLARAKNLTVLQLGVVLEECHVPNLRSDEAIIDKEEFFASMPMILVCSRSEVVYIKACLE